MRRRAFLIGSLILSMPALAQQAVPVIGYLGAESPEAFASRIAAFKQGLGEMNYAEGRNVAIEYRWAYGDNARLPELAAELVRQRVTVLVAAGSAPAAIAAKKATSTIPIVFEVGIDPAAGGLVRTMNRPGGNATGVTSLNTQVGPKRLQLLSELVPGAKTFALLVNPTNPKNFEAMTDDLQVSAHAQRLQLQIVQAATEQDLAVVFENLARQHIGGLVIGTNDVQLLGEKDGDYILHLKREVLKTGKPSSAEVEFSTTEGTKIYEIKVQRTGLDCSITAVECVIGHADMRLRHGRSAS